MKKVDNLAPWTFAAIENEGTLLQRVRDALSDTEWDGLRISASIPEELPESFSWIVFGGGNEASDGLMLWTVSVFAAGPTWLSAEKLAIRLRSILSAPLFPVEPIMSTSAFTAHRRSTVLGDAEKPVYTFDFILGQLADFSEI